MKHRPKSYMIFGRIQTVLKINLSFFIQHKITNPLSLSKANNKATQPNSERDTTVKLHGENLA